MIAEKEMNNLLPIEIADSITELERLYKRIKNNGKQIADVIAYETQLSMFLSDIKIALLNGKISQYEFQELKDRFL